MTAHQQAGTATPLSDERIAELAAEAWGKFASEGMWNTLDCTAHIRDAILTAAREALEAKERDRQYHMDCINRLAARIDALGEQSSVVVDKAIDTIATAEAALAGAREDAMRYRWIRQHGDEVQGDDCKGHFVEWVRKYGDRPDELDKRIDAAGAQPAPPSPPGNGSTERGA